MIQLIKTVSVLAVLVAVLGTFTVYGVGRTTDVAFAEGHEGGGDPPPDCCDAPPPDDSPPPDCCDAPPPDDSPPPDSYECTDCTYEEPPPDSYDCTDCTFEPPPDGGYVDCTDCTFEPPPDGGYFECTDCIFEPPPEFYDCADCNFDYSSFDGAYQFEGASDPAGGEFHDPSIYEGSFTFDPNGAFIFDNANYVEGGDTFFPDGQFFEFFDPGDFAQGEFVDIFNPDAFAGDFGDFFQGGDFGTGEFEQFFDPESFRPDEFGTFFQFEAFNPGDFGNFAAIGEQFIDFGGHFDQFFGERSENAFAATDYFSGITPGDFNFIRPEDLLGELHNLDYQGFQSLDSGFVADLFREGVSGEEFDLRGDQWAGAFSRFDVEDIRSFDHDFIADAVHNFAPGDFLGIPDDQAFAMFQATFFGGPLPGAIVKDSSAEGLPPPPPFNPIYFEDRLDEFHGQIGGFLGAMGPDYFGEIEDGQLVDMFSRIDFSGPDFDRTVLGGDDLGGIFGALDYESFAGLTDEHILDAIGFLEAKDFGAWDPEAAYNVFDNIAFGQLVEFEHLDGLVGAIGFEQIANLDDEKLVDLIGTFAFGGPDFDLAASALDGADIAGLIGALDGDHLGELGGVGILEAIQHLVGTDLVAWEGGTAFDVFSTIGFEQALGLDQLEGIVGNFAAEHIQQLGDDLGGLLGSLDFHNNGDVLRDFSFDTLGILSPEDFQGLDVQQLVDLANTTGGDGIVGLDPQQIQNIVESIRAEFFEEFDPSVVGGMFAGLDHDQIAGFDHETLEAALEAVGANLLGGLGDFDAIAGANTAFDELANLVGFAEALELDGSFVIQDGAFVFFGGNLFGSS